MFPGIVCHACNKEFKSSGDAFLVNFQFHRLDFTEHVTFVHVSLRCGRCVATNYWKIYLNTEECRQLYDYIQNFKNPLCDNKHPVEVF